LRESHTPWVIKEVRVKKLTTLFIASLFALTVALPAAVAAPQSDAPLVVAAADTANKAKPAAKAKKAKAAKKDATKTAKAKKDKAAKKDVAKKAKAKKDKAKAKDAKKK